MKKLLFGLLVVLLIACTGCKEIGPASPSDGYATQNKTTSIEYRIYINKQITVFVNQISTRMGICKNANEGYFDENEKILANDSLRILNDTYSETCTVYPPNGADEDREMVLNVMKTAITHMEDYIECLENGTSIEEYFKIFENDFIQLTGAASLYYE